MSFNAVFTLLIGVTVATYSNLASAQDREPGSSHDYATTDIEFNAHDGVEMRGRLVLPNSAQLPRAIVMAVQTAEGATVDMKRPLGGGKTFNYFDLYRKHLTAKNIGFFSYDGRGIGMGPDLPGTKRLIGRSTTPAPSTTKSKTFLAQSTPFTDNQALPKLPFFCWVPAKEPFSRRKPPQKDQNLSMV